MHWSKQLNRLTAVLGSGLKTMFLFQVMSGIHSKESLVFFVHLGRGKVPNFLVLGLLLLVWGR